jgi:hypothetical protein
VIVFPAGEVSRLGPRGIRDSRWRRGFLRFARACDAPVLPVRIHARNSALFYGASALFKPAGPPCWRERCSRGAAADPLAGRQSIRLDAGGRRRRRTAARATHVVCASVHASPQARARGGSPHPEPLVDAVDPAACASASPAAVCSAQTGDGKQIRVGTLAVDAPLLREIGRLRELTFREVGEGTGRSVDLDAWDSWYEHIVLWDDAASKVVGCLPHRPRRAGAGRARHPRPVHRIVVRLRRRCHRPHRTRHGARP